MVVYQEICPTYNSVYPSTTRSGLRRVRWRRTDQYRMYITWNTSFRVAIPMKKWVQTHIHDVEYSFSRSRIEIYTIISWMSTQDCDSVFGHELFLLTWPALFFAGLFSNTLRHPSLHKNNAMRQSCRQKIRKDMASTSRPFRSPHLHQNSSTQIKSWPYAILPSA